jgi:hypothetical protein
MSDTILVPAEKVIKKGKRPSFSYEVPQENKSNELPLRRRKKHAKGAFKESDSEPKIGAKPSKRSKKK